MELNVDAGVGVLIWDHWGKVLLIAWRAVSDAGSAEEVEAYTCREGLLLAAEWTPHHAILETDCAKHGVSS